VFKFLKIEIEKAKLKRYILIILGFNLIILFYALYVYYRLQIDIDKGISEQSILFSYDGAFGLCDSIIRCMMMLVAAFLINKIIINEYNNNTMDIIFLCPVDRKKVIRIKAFSVVLLTFLGLVFGQFFTAVGSTFLAYIFDFINQGPTSVESADMFIRYIYNDVCFSLIGLIPLSFGMKCKAARSTLSAAVIVIIIMFFGLEQIVFSFLPFKLPITPAVLAIGGIISLLLSMKMAEKECKC